MAKLSNLSIYIPLLEAIQKILRYAKILKNLMSKKNLIEGDMVEVTHGFSVIMSSKITKKMKTPEILPSLAPSEHICLQKLYATSVRLYASSLSSLMKSTN